MQLHITHETLYRFDHPTRMAVQYLRLTPKDTPLQRVLAWTVEAPDSLTPWTDGHGNTVHSLTVHRALPEIRLVARGVVETQDRAGVLGDLGEALPPLYWLRAGPRTQVGPAIRDFLSGLRLEPLTRLDQAHELMRAIGARVPYRPGITDVATTAEEVLSHNAGVCQDHAHLFAACAREIGIPTRYVSGYLLSGPVSGPQDVSHAWAEAWIDGLGWVGFDPANGLCPTDHYVRVAVGLDYDDTAPVRGIQGGGHGEDLSVQVSIAPMKDTPQRETGDQQQ